MAVFVVNVVYACFAVALLLLTDRRAAGTLTDQRRIRVLMVGAVVTVVAGTAGFGGLLRHPPGPIFSPRPPPLPPPRFPRVAPFVPFPHPRPPRPSPRP